MTEGEPSALLASAAGRTYEPRTLYRKLEFKKMEREQLSGEVMPPKVFPRNHTSMWTVAALREIYGADGLLGVTELICLEQVNTWRKGKGLGGVSTATLRRAKKCLREQSIIPTPTD
jgi:hypothetical protein